MDYEKCTMDSPVDTKESPETTTSCVSEETNTSKPQPYPEAFACAPSNDGYLDPRTAADRRASYGSPPYTNRFDSLNFTHQPAMSSYREAFPPSAPQSAYTPSPYTASASPYYGYEPSYNYDTAYHGAQLPPQPYADQPHHQMEYAPPGAPPRYAGGYVSAPDSIDEAKDHHEEKKEKKMSWWKKLFCVWCCSDQCDDVCKCCCACMSCVGACCEILG